MAIKIAGVDVINDDRELVLAKLTDINETVNDTAVDVFVYDTSKDSDGGAWRHRTQHTSWYNESASSTRGSRAEFPAVAVIVAEASKVTIYDGDDPSLPMWMVFDESTGVGLTSGNIIPDDTVSSVSMQASVICIGVSDTSGRGGLIQVKFVADAACHFDDTTSNANYKGPISDRNSGKGYSSDPSFGVIVNSAVNDVAMTVLPDAPTDPATGLPVPTIAVATDGGVSVIKDDGTVVDITHSVAADIFTTVSFTNDNRLATFLQGVKDVYVMPIPASDYSVDLSSDDTTYNELSAPYLFSTSAFIFPSDLKPLATPDGLAIIRNEVGAIHGISQLAEDPTTQANGMVAYTTSTYNTGWMNGDIKLAALADTTAETLSGSELVTDFSTYASDADFFADGFVRSDAVKVTFDAVNDTLDMTDGANVRLDGHVSFVEGTPYQVSITNDGPDGASFQDNFSDFQRSIVSGTDTFVFTKGSGVNVRLVAGAGKTVSISNISVRLADPDRSVNGKGLGVHGSITKTAVATGADVVAYSGFSASNYLEQPYNSDLDFGTGDFCVMGWLKDDPTTTATDYVVSRRDVARVGAGLEMYIDASHKLSLFIGGTPLTSTASVRTNSWVHVCAYRQSGTIYLYIDGVSQGSASNANNLTNTSAPLFMGGASNNTSHFNTGSLALWRISATAPTADQIAKIYNDEKLLFQDSAKATLTGSSDAVTALAHDPDTGLLHVGTSGGRSVFQGLRRVDETATAVTTAISAVDGLVVEQ